jgi:conjugative transfer signal peptidase TraF
MSAGTLPRPNLRRISLLVAFSVAATFAMACAGLAIYFQSTGLRVTCNHSESMPIGCYARHPVGVLSKGDAVDACLPPIALRVAVARAYLRSGGPCDGHETVLKLVAALPGDTVVVTNERVLVNGAILPLSARVSTDSHGRNVRLMPPGIYRLRPGEVWLETPVAASWDSRYYGAFRRADIFDVATPIFTVR